jgi:signal transduction histidine kinase
MDVMGTWGGKVKAGSSARPALWVGAPLSLAVGLLFYIATVQSIEHDSRERFAGHARNGQHSIRARIAAYTNLLRGTASLFQMGEPIDRARFHAYVSGLNVAQHYPAIETINFAVHVDDADRPAFERRMLGEQAAGDAPFAIEPPGQRPAYEVLAYVEPSPQWGRIRGLDILANARVQETLESMRDSGKLLTSGQPIRAISGPNRTGLGMRLPVYRPDLPLNSVTERRAAYMGSVGIAFSVDKLILGVLEEMSIRKVRMTLVDIAPGPGGREQMLFDSSATEQNQFPAAASASSHFSTRLPVEFYGRQWWATFTIDKNDMYTGFEGYLPWLAMLAGFISSMLIYALFHALSSSRRRAIKMAKGMTRELRDSQAKLQLSHQNLRRLAAHADQIKEGERKRIAREIHDDLGQNLLALRIEADLLASRTESRHPRLHARARSTLLQIDATIKSVRQIINDLRPNVLDLGLNAAVEWQIAEFRRRTGIACELVGAQHEIKMPDHCATAFFRILQESLSNIVRHARATEVKVELRTHGGRLMMTVGDNGVGMQVGTRNKSGSFGLVGIEERIHILHGSFAITSMPGAGTIICVSVPLHMPPLSTPQQSVASVTPSNAIA